MSKKLYPEEDIQNIANAIRTLNGSSDTYTVSEMASAIELPENGYYLKESASANPLSITDGEELNAQSCEVTFSPIQDLHGQSAPYPAGSGKNKLNKADSSVSANSTWLNVDCILPAGTYTFSFKSSATSGQCTFNVFDSNGDRIYQAPNSIQLASTVTHTFTISSAGARVSSYINVASNISEVMIEVGSTKTDFAPYSNICPISGRDSVVLTRTGKNLFGGTYDALFPLHFGNDTEITVSAKTSSAFRFGYYDINENLIDYYGVNTTFGDRKYRTITLPKETYFVEFYYVSVEDMQIELGSTATAYEPYQGETYTATFENTEYGGSRDFVTGEGTSNYDMVDLGTLTWTKDGNNRYYHRFSSDFNMKTWLSNQQPNGYCSCYSMVTQSEYTRLIKEGLTITLSKQLPTIMIYDTNYNGSDFQSYINGNTLCYELATPIEITLTAEQIELLKGNNVLWSDSNGNVKLKYFSKSLS